VLDQLDRQIRRGGALGLGCHRDAQINWLDRSTSSQLALACLLPCPQSEHLHHLSESIRQGHEGGVLW
jgi:hypothetical protein